MIIKILIYKLMICLNCLKSPKIENIQPKMWKAKYPEALVLLVNSDLVNHALDQAVDSRQPRTASTATSLSCRYRSPNHACQVGRHREERAAQVTGERKRGYIRNGEYKFLHEVVW